MTTNILSPDALSTDPSPEEEVRDVQVAIVGAGLSGTAAAVKLDRAGIRDFVILEKANHPGGVWRDNTYPGCGVDIPSALYSFSFNPNPRWPRNFPSQADLLDYIEDTVDTHGLRDRLHLGTEMLDARWDGERARWLLRTPQGTIVAQHVIFATGPLTEPAIPDIDGLNDFAGEVFHSARWRHDVNLRGKRVVVVGTGASAIQFVPQIAPDTAELILLQRTASWILPKPDFAFPRAVQGVFSMLPVTQRAYRDGIDAVLRTATVLMRRASTARLLTPVALGWHRWQLRDNRSLRAALRPDFVIGCKRLLFSNDYLKALNQPNVTVVPSALKNIKSGQVETADGRLIDADVIIFGTGFNASQPPIAGRVYDGSGRLVAERWKDSSPQAYLATAVDDLPNAWLLLGPNVLVYNSFLAISEAQIDYIIDAITTLEREGIDAVSIDSSALHSYNRELQEALRPTVFNSGGCRSFYHDANGRNFATWPWSFGEMRRRLQRFDLHKYNAVQARETARTIR